MKPLIIITHSGQDCEIETVGYKGPACEAATKAIEEVLGQVRSRRKKPEYHQTAGASKTLNTQRSTLN